ncbi:tetraspanin family protein, partial [Striga asiatica]
MANPSTTCQAISVIGAEQGEGFETRRSLLSPACGGAVKLQWTRRSGAVNSSDAAEGATFVVTNSVAGKVLSGRGYREYRLGDYSNWLQNRVNDHWGRVRSYLVDSNICQRLLQAGSTPVDDFYREHLSALQFFHIEIYHSGCCKPSNDCNFTYVSPTNWTRPQTPASSNPDCARWSNEPRVLCYGCDSCKAGLLDKSRPTGREFPNNREDNSAWK